MRPEISNLTSYRIEIFAFSESGVRPPHSKGSRAPNFMERTGTVRTTRKCEAEAALFGVRWLDTAF